MSGRRDSALERAAFVLDLNRCTGCHACQLACSIENELGFDRSWREIITFNERRHPAIPLHHLSLACHHCAGAPCMRGCPASAYTRDAGTGAVLLDAGKCIGCRYCLWVCPYDAPRFDAATGVMSKCTFCSHRLAAGQEPACTTACPTGALDFGTLAGTVTDVETPVAGLPRVGIGPALRVHPLRPGAAVREMATSTPPPVVVPPAALPPLDLGGPAPAASGDISVRSEWTLVVFTLLVAVLVALFGATLTGERVVDPLAFLGVALVGMGLSTLHLGRKRHAWRAVFNLGTSWLSREVAGFGAFLALAALHLLFPAASPVFGWPAMAAGIWTLVAMDQVYRSIPAAERRTWHSADVLLTAAYLLGFLARNPWVFATAGLIKLVLYLGRRRIRHWGTGNGARRAGMLRWMLLRVGVGLLAPALLWLWTPAAGTPAAWMSLALAVLLIGEFIDRCEFYDELEPPSPRRQVAVDLAVRLRDAG